MMLSLKLLITCAKEHDITLLDIHECQLKFVWQRSVRDI